MFRKRIICANGRASGTERGARPGARISLIAGFGFASALLAGCASTEAGQGASSSGAGANVSPGASVSSPSPQSDPLRVGNPPSPPSAGPNALAVQINGAGKVSYPLRKISCGSGTYTAQALNGPGVRLAGNQLDLTFSATTRLTFTVQVTHSGQSVSAVGTSQPASAATLHLTCPA
jgi:hypothetical protein